MNSGVRVHEIAEYEDLPLLLTELVRRTRPPRLFISGSMTDDTHDRVCEEMAKALADRTEWEVCSLVGPAGWEPTRGLARIRRAEGTYDPTRLAERRGDLDTRQLGG